MIDGTYERKLGDLVLVGADTVVWLDLPLRVWFPRLLARTLRRIRGREALWNDNTESLRGAFWGRDSLFGWALRKHFERRRDLADRACPLPRRETADAERGRPVSQRLRALNSASHAAPRSPIQIGVRPT